jgi:hypothetical protein
MRLDINLASRPYEDAGQFWLRWGALLGAVGLVTLILLGMTASGWYAARQDRRKIRDLRAQIAERDREKAAAEALLARPENRTIRDKSQYLNYLIARKAFSWTQAFEDLEKIMPAQLHLLSIHPELNDENQLAISMTVGGSSRDHAIQLMRRMEDSQRFHDTKLMEEVQLQAQSGSTDTVKFQIVALYAPAVQTGSIH